MHKHRTGRQDSFKSSLLNALVIAIGTAAIRTKKVISPGAGASHTNKTIDYE